MPKATLKFSDRELMAGTGTITIGRTVDNAISFPDDSNVSRNHAEIEIRGEDFCLIDLGSSNGTEVNGAKVEGETVLSDGDTILLGGTSEITFELYKEEEQKASGGGSASMTGSLPDAASDDASAVPTASSEEVSTGSRSMLMVAGGACLVAVIAVAAAGSYYYSRGSSCTAKAVITKPEQGDTIIVPTEIEVDINDGSCVESASFMIDGVEFAKADGEPSNVMLDPAEFPDLSDGMDHGLTIILKDKDGTPVSVSQSILLAFETRAITKPSPGPEVAGTNPQPSTGPKEKEVSLIEVQEMTVRLAKQFPGNFKYNVSNKQFLQEIQKRTAEYAQEGYYDRASKYRDAINVAFVREQNLPAPLGYMLAMSRSKFNLEKAGTDEGIWKMSSDFVTSNAYNGLCGTETLTDPSQNCAAKAASLYMKSMVFGVFEGDVVFAAAAFGKSPQDAGVCKATLPANRTDVWGSIKTAPEREKLVRFFAAGIVAENPQKFGLKKDKPLSELYRVTM